MTTALLIQIGLLVILLVLSAFFSSSEVAFFYLDPLDVRRMHEEHPEQTRRVEEILVSPTTFLSTILIGNTLVNVGVSAVAYSIAEKMLHHHGEAAAVAGSLLLLLIFGEIGPKRVAVTYPSRMAALYTRPLLFFIFLFRPLRLLTEKVTTSFEHLFRQEGKVLSEDEFETIVDVSREEGVLDEDERAMVKGIIGLEDFQASDVMTPRVDLAGIDLEEVGQDVEEIVRKARVRQLLVYQDQLDNVVGLLDVRSFLLDPDHRIQPALTTPLFVPEASPLDKLLAQFLQEQRRAAVVVDEYGGTAGLITRGDILEEITGDLDDEQGRHELLFGNIGPNRWVLDGRVSLETISERLDLEFEEEGVDRIAGWATAKLERIPRTGDRVQTEHFEVLVRQMRRNRVTLVELLKRDASE